MKYDEKRKELEELYKDPEGFWRVAEMDEYGRGYYRIGDYFGHFADIALHVKAEKKTMRPLVFEKLDIQRMTVPTDATGDVFVVMSPNSPFAKYNISSEETCEEYRESCESKGIKVFSQSHMQAGEMRIRRESKESHLRAEAMKKIRAALSAEEMAALFPDEANSIEQDSEEEKLKF